MIKTCDNCKHKIRYCLQGEFMFNYCELTCRAITDDNKDIECVNWKAKRKDK